MSCHVLENHMPRLLDVSQRGLVCVTQEANDYNLLINHVLVPINKVLINLPRCWFERKKATSLLPSWVSLISLIETEAISTLWPMHQLVACQDGHDGPARERQINVGQTRPVYERRRTGHTF